MLAALPQFRCDVKNSCNVIQRDRFAAEQYVAGRSLHELSELTERTHTAVRRSLDRTGNPRRGLSALSARAAGRHQRDRGPGTSAEQGSTVTHATICSVRFRA